MQWRPCGFSHVEVAGAAFDHIDVHLQVVGLTLPLRIALVGYGNPRLCPMRRKRGVRAIGGHTQFVLVAAVNGKIGNVLDGHPKIVAHVTIRECACHGVRVAAEGCTH